MLLQSNLFVTDVREEICVKTVDTCLFVCDSVPGLYKAQESWDELVSKEPFYAKLLPW